MITLLLNSKLPQARLKSPYRWILCAVVGMLLMGAASQAEAQSQYARPTGTVAGDGGWTAVNAPTIWDAINDDPSAVDSDYMQVIKSGGGSSEVKADTTLTLTTPFPDPGVDTGHIVRARAIASDTGGSATQVTLYLLQGPADTEIASWTDTIAGSYTDIIHTLLTTEAQNITNYDNLRIRVESLGVDRRNEFINFTWLELETPAPVTDPPTVITPVATTIDISSAWLGATVQDGAPIDERGTYWNDTGTTPITQNPVFESGTFPAESFSLQSSGMPAGTQIYFRGYAVNGAGTGYSPDGTFFTEPNEATSVVWGTIADNSLQFNWTSGGPDSALVVMRMSGTGAVAPDDGDDTYTASTTYGSGTDLGGGNYVVHIGAAGWVTVSGLLSGTGYSVDVYEYAGSGSLINYQQDNPATGTETTTGIQPSHNVLYSAQCTQCHFHHSSLPEGNDQLDACATCHSESGPASSKTNIGLHEVTGGSGPQTVGCGACHEVHKYDFTVTDTHSGGITAPNSSRIRWNTTKYIPQALEPALFQNSSQFAFDEANAPWNGICQSCHKITDHHTNDGTGDHAHEVTKPCTDCHNHGAGFGADLCSTCHNTARGPRRAVMSDFTEQSRHLQGAQLDEADCEVCHEPPANHQDQTDSVWLKNVDGGASIELTGDPSTSSTEAAKLNAFCLACHDSDGANGDTTPFSDGITVPDINTAWQTPAAHDDASISCYGDGTFGCHGNGHGSKKYPLLAPADVAPTAPAYAEEQEGFCFNCHDSDGPATWNIKDLFLLSNHHPVTYSDQQSGGHTGRSPECVVCHDPHDAIVPSVLPPDRDATVGYIQGVWGVDPYSTPTPYDIVNPIAEENQLCFRCHANFAGIAPGTNPGDGGPDNDADKSALFDPANATFHPVVGLQDNPYTTSTETNGNTITMEPPYNQNPGEHSRVWCSDCHRNINASGPHGSNEASIQRDGLSAVDSGDGYYTPLCVICHKYTSYVSGASGSNFSAHNNNNHKIADNPDGGASVGYGGCLSCHFGYYLSGGQGYDNDLNMVHGGSTGFTFMSGTRVTNWAPGTCTVVNAEGCGGHTKSY